MRQLTLRLVAVVCVSFALNFNVKNAGAADWPMYRADAGRTGYTAEALTAPLSLVWEQRSIHAAAPAWPRDERITFDRAHRVVIVAGTLFFTSSADGGIHAIDVATGAAKWTFFTGAPVRFAPAVWNDQVFATSDDGYLYCVSAADGTLIRKWRGGPNDQMVLGNEHLVSRWPARGGVVILNDTVYFAAGIWPSDGIYLHAVDAKSGEVVWTNDKSGGIYMAQPHGGASAASGVAVQGHLVATADHLFVPTGRAVPAAFSRKDGKFKYYHLQKNGHRGGTTTMAAGALFFNSGLPFVADTGDALAAVGSGALAVVPGGLVNATGTKLRVLKQIEKTTNDRKGQPVKTLAYSESAAIGKVAGSASLIVAGNTAFCGGDSIVTAVDLTSRKVVWTGKVEGTAYDLAVANGRLFVSTDRGAIHAFAAKSKSKPIVQRRDLKDLPVNNLFAKAADEIIKSSKITDGYCVDLGCGDGSLVIELARKTKLRIYAVDSNADNVAAARRRLSAAGLYGTRVTVHLGNPDKTNYPKYFANLIVSGRSVADGTAAINAKEVFRMQRPYGGIACLGKPGAMKVTTRGALAKAGKWTHQYMNPANTLCSDDEIVKGPLHVLWYRDIDLEMPQRHGRGHAPLFDQGRLFVEGLDALRGVDAYNGRVLWEFELPGVQQAYSADHIMGTSGTGSNFCVADEGVFVRVKDHCFRLDPATGKVLGKFTAPKHKDGKSGVWGYIACHRGILFGSLVDEQHIVRHAWRPADMSKLFTESKFLFALDAQSGKVKWRYAAKNSIRHNTLAIGDGRVFLIDRPAAVKDLLNRRTAAKEKTDDEHKTGELVCLDAETGKSEWTSNKDIFGTLLAFSEKFDMLLMSYQSTRFKLPSEVGGRMAVFRASEGYRVWDKKVNYVTRPLINDRVIYAQPGALDLLNGETAPFQMKRSYGCGQMAGSRNLLLFRSATLGYVDLSRKAGTENFGGMRPGCWVNALPVGGLVLIPDASAGCRCSYQNRSWVALQGSD